MGIHSCWWRFKSGIFFGFLLFLVVCSILFGFLGSFLSLGYRLQVGLLLFLVIWVMVRCSWFCLVVLCTGVCGWNRRVFYCVSQSYFIPAEICCWFYLGSMVIFSHRCYHLIFNLMMGFLWFALNFFAFIVFVLLLQIGFPTLFATFWLRDIKVCFPKCLDPQIHSYCLHYWTIIFVNNDSSSISQVNPIILAVISPAT